MRRDRLALLALALAVLACNLRPGIPVTPTVGPTVLPSPTDTATAIVLLPSFTPTETFTPSPTFTPTETPPPSMTPSVSATATNTAHPTSTATATQMPTGTPTNLPTLTDTPLPTDTPIPSETATLVPTATDTPTTTLTLVPSPTDTPPSNSPTPAPPTPIRDLGLITLTPTLVPLPSVATAVPTLAQQPTARVITAAPPTVRALPSATSIEIPLPAPTALVIGTPLQPGSAPAAGVSILRDRDTSIQGVTAFIDPGGRLTVGNQPFTGTLPWGVESRFTNVRWSPDGRFLAIVVEIPNAPSYPPDSTRLINDGLWVWDSTNNQTYFVYRQIYHEVRAEGPRLIDDIIWSPDNDAILVNLGRGRLGKASVLVGVGGAIAQPSQYANIAQGRPLWDYAGGSALDDQRFVVTGSAAGQPSRLGILYRDGRFEQVADGAALGMWMQNATQLPDGRYAFLGKPSPTGRSEDSPQPLRLYVMSPGGQPSAVSGVLSGNVLGADWDPGRQNLSVRIQTAQGINTIRLRP
jgi:hypothetical protein